MKLLLFPGSHRRESILGAMKVSESWLPLLSLQPPHPPRPPLLQPNQPSCYFWNSVLKCTSLSCPPLFRVLFPHGPMWLTPSLLKKFPQPTSVKGHLPPILRILLHSLLNWCLLSYGPFSCPPIFPVFFIFLLECRLCRKRLFIFLPWLLCFMLIEH